MGSNKNKQQNKVTKIACVNKILDATPCLFFLEKNGGKIVGSVSSKLNYLVVGEDAGSKLDKAKKLNSVSVISEAEFLKMLK